MASRKLKMAHAGKIGTALLVLIILIVATCYWVCDFQTQEFLLFFLGIAILGAILVLHVVTDISLKRNFREFAKTEKRISRQMSRVGRGNAVLQIQSLLNLQRPLNWQDTYMIGPDVLLVGLERVLERDDALIVECGSGISSVVFGFALKKNGSGKVISIDHDKEYAEISRKRIAERGLSEQVEVVYAPLKEYSFKSGKWLWYDMDVLTKALPKAIDFVLVDGPPGNLQKMSRYPALPLLLEHLSPRADLLIDDYHRQDEKDIADKWMKENKGFRLDEYKFTEKGAAIMSRSDNQV